MLSWQAWPLADDYRIEPRDHQQLRDEGVPAIYGDASHPDTLKNAGIDKVGTLILSASGIHAAIEVIRLAKELNPQIRVLVRTGYLREQPALQQAGADLVFAGEGEVALAMSESILTTLGATPEQIDRERDRLNEDLYPYGTLQGL